MLLIGVKGHAGMSPRRNFGRGGGGGKPKRVSIKPKTTLPHGEKSSRKAFKRWKKAAPHKKNGAKRPPHREKNSRKAFKR